MNANESIAEEEQEPGARQIIEFSKNQTDRRNTGWKQNIAGKDKACLSLNIESGW